MSAVAIVGMSVLLPGAPDLETYWRNLLAGADMITEVPPHRWDPMFYDPDATDRADRVYCRRGGFVDSFATLDPGQFGIMPSSIADTDPDQLLALRVAASAVADAGGPGRLGAADRVGVVLGRGGYLSSAMVRLDQRVRTANQLTHTLREILPGVAEADVERVRVAFTERLGPYQPEAAIGLVPNLTASRIANRLDLRGPAYTVDAACASSLIAVDHAVAELASGRCDAVLAGGVHHCHDITLWSVFSQLRALSRTGHIRPFDQRADGILIGEGTGIVVLKRLADAVSAGDRIYAVVTGSGVASDGRGASLFNPDPAGQARAIRLAWQAAGLNPAAPGSLGLLEAHGTGTPVGDAAELATLARVFGPDGPPAVIGSVKSMIGHTMPAAGVASLVKAALAVYHGMTPPTLHCDEPHPELSRTRFVPIAVAREWESTGIRRAGVNAFGFGGVNAHVVLEQSPVAARPRRAQPPTAVAVVEPEVVLRFAGDLSALRAALAADDAAVRSMGIGQPPDTAPDGCRLALVAPTARRLAMARRVLAQGAPWRGRGDVWLSPAPLLRDDRAGVAFVFPGLEAEFTPHVSDVAEHFGLPIPHIPPAEVASLGRHSVAVVAVGRLLDGVLRHLGIRPDMVAGHSIGEWGAMLSGGLFTDAAVDGFLASFDPDAIRVPGMVFAAVGAGVDLVASMVSAHPGVVVSHDNAPRQSIVCGPRAAVEELVRRLRGRNVLCRVLPFQSGFHTPMLAPYLDDVRAVVDRFTLYPPTLPVWSATIAAPFPADPARVRELFIRHLLEPVRFRAMIHAMYDAGARVFVQVGTGALAALIGDILHGQDFLAVAANVPRHSGIAQLRRVLAALWAEGARPDWAALDGPGARSATDIHPVRREGAPPIRLNLGGALVHLGDVAPDLLPAPTYQPRGLPVPLADPTRLAADMSIMAANPAGARLADLLRDTARDVAAVITAHGAGQATGRAEHSVLRVSTETMPYLRDHCFFWQRPGWPVEEDRWPVVPATTIVHHMMAAAERCAPGRYVTALHDVRFARWMAASPPVDVPVTVTWQDANRVRVSCGAFAQAVVTLADGYDVPPAPGRVDPTGERSPVLTAERLYRERWLFHGPRFQGVTRLSAVAATHIRGVLTTPDAPGALLDNVGQLLGCWIMEEHVVRTVVFPVAMRHVRFFGAHPPPGTPVECAVWVVSLTDTELVADVELVCAGRVWARVEGWVDRRFDSHPETRAVERWPERNTLSVPQQGGWALTFERWPDLATRELVMRNQLGVSERADYEQQPPRARRGWLLGRVAVKDAVRRRLWDAGTGPIFPAELTVVDDGVGRAVVTGEHGRELGEFDVSFAHHGEVGVAMCRPRPVPDAAGTAVGIAIHEVGGNARGLSGPEGDSGPERDVLAAVCGSGPGARAVWLARFVAAKRAVEIAAQVFSTGTVAAESGQGPTVVGATEATEAAEAMLTVAVSGCDDPGRRHLYQVRCVPVTNPVELPARCYVVAWITQHTIVDDCAKESC